MEISQQETQFVLNHVMRTLNDAREGFEEAAQHAEGTGLKEVLMRAALERSEFFGQLERAVHRYGGEPISTSHTSPDAAARRLWTSIKSAFSERDNEAIVSDCINAEENTQEHFEQALKSNLPQEVKDTLNLQLESIQQTIHNLAELQGKVGG